MPFIRCGTQTDPGTSPSPGQLTVTFNFSGTTHIFRESTATAADPYIEPTGAFIQDHWIARNSSLPTVTVHFCRDRGINPRPEVWIYHGYPLFKNRATGAVWATTEIADLPAHTVTISDETGVRKLQNMPNGHYHRRWWRWQANGPRQIIRPVDYLLTNRWILPYNRNLTNVVFDVQASQYGTFPPAPMADGGIETHMGTAGERPDIGPLTGAQSRYIFRQDNWTDVLIWAEASGAIPMHWQDEVTGRPVEIYDFPLIQGHPNQVSHAYHVRQLPSENSSWGLEYAHWPTTAALPAMMTGDPYYVMMCQAQVGWWFTKNRRFPVAGNLDVGPFVDTQTRGFAWRTRDMIVAWRVTPDVTPSWLNSRSYLTRLLNGWCREWQRRWFEVQSADQDLFHTSNVNTPNGDVSVIREGFYTIALAWHYWMGAPSTPVGQSSPIIQTLAQWKADTNVAMAAGRDGFPRQYCTPYQTDTDAFLAASNWREVYNLCLTAAPGPGLPWVPVNTADANLQNERGGGPDWWFANQVLGSLYTAKLAGVTGEELTNGITYMLAQCNRTGTGTGNGRKAKYAWTV